jgi:hypothetical protein
MDIEDLDAALNAALERSIGSRGTYLDAHILALAVLRGRKIWSVTAAIGVAGWALLAIAMLI